jgi:hypothetical protein
MSGIVLWRTNSQHPWNWRSLLRSGLRRLAILGETSRRSFGADVAVRMYGPPSVRTQKREIQYRDLLTSKAITTGQTDLGVCDGFRIAPESRATGINWRVATSRDLSVSLSLRIHPGCSVNYRANTLAISPNLDFAPAPNEACVRVRSAQVALRRGHHPRR